MKVWICSSVGVAAKEDTPAVTPCCRSGTGMCCPVRDSAEPVRYLHCPKPGQETSVGLQGSVHLQQRGDR